MNIHLYTLLALLSISINLLSMDLCPIMVLLQQAQANYKAQLEERYNVGRQLYYSGIPENLPTALHNLNIVANNNHVFEFTADAQILIGQIHLYGLHANPQNATAALTCFSRASQAENLKDAYKAHLYIARMYAEGHFGVTDFSSAQQEIAVVQQGLSSLDSRTQQMLQAHIDYLNGLQELREKQNAIAAQRHFQNVRNNPLAGGQTKYASQQLLQQLAPPQ